MTQVKFHTTLKIPRGEARNELNMDFASPFWEFAHWNLAWRIARAMWRKKYIWHIEIVILLHELSRVLWTLDVYFLPLGHCTLDLDFSAQLWELRLTWNFSVENRKGRVRNVLDSWRKTITSQYLFYYALAILRTKVQSTALWTEPLNGLQHTAPYVGWASQPVNLEFSPHFWEWRKKFGVENHQVIMGNAFGGPCFSVH